MWTMDYEGLTLKFRNVEQVLEFLNTQTNKKFKFSPVPTRDAVEFRCDPEIIAAPYTAYEVPKRFHIMTPHQPEPCKLDSRIRFEEVLDRYLGDDRYQIRVSISFL